MLLNPISDSTVQHWTCASPAPGNADVDPPSTEIHAKKVSNTPAGTWVKAGQPGKDGTHKDKLHLGNAASSQHGGMKTDTVSGRGYEIPPPPPSFLLLQR